MGGYTYTRNQINLGAADSGTTGSPWFVGDFANLTVSIATSSTSASRFTIMGSNLDGFNSTLSISGGFGSYLGSGLGWSHITVITSQGLYTIDPGFRWINALRSDFNSGSASSNATIIFEGKT